MTETLIYCHVALSFSLHKKNATAPSAPMSRKGVQRNTKDNGNILRTALAPTKKGKKDMMAVCS